MLKPGNSCYENNSGVSVKPYIKNQTNTWFAIGVHLKEKY